MKIPFVDYELYSKIVSNNVPQTDSNIPETINSSVIQTNSRSSVIVNNFVGRIISVYNGRESKRIKIKPEMVGYKLGCFVFTKKLGESIHRSERNRKKADKMKRKITQKKVRKPTATSSAAKKKPLAPAKRKK